MTVYKVRHLDTKASSSQPSWGDKTCFVVKDCCLSLMTPTRQGTSFVNEPAKWCSYVEGSSLTQFVAAGDSKTYSDRSAITLEPLKWMNNGCSAVQGHSASPPQAYLWQDERISDQWFDAKPRGTVLHQTKPKVGDGSVQCGFKKGKICITSVLVSSLTELL